MAAEYLRKYGVATHVYVPMIKRGVVDFALGADWTPAAGDVKVSIDGAAAANIATLPVAIAMGNTAMWDFAFSAAEVTGKKISCTVGDAAAKAVEDQMITIMTYGNASAELVQDLSAAVYAANATQQNGVALPPIYVGTFQAGSTANTAVLQSGTTASQFCNGDICIQTSGSTAGQQIEGASQTGMGTGTPVITAVSGQTWTPPAAGVTYFILKKGGLVSALASDFWSASSRSLSSDGAQALFNTVLTESYSALGAAPTLAQVMMFIQQMLSNARVSGNTMTVYALDGVTVVRTLTLNAAYPATLPTSISPSS